jgi:hypothetical protein
MENRSLSQAIIFDTISDVATLLNQKANVNEKDIYGLTPLIESVLKGNSEITTLLLDNGAMIDQQDISGQTALQWAVNRRQMTVIDLLLKRGANPNHYSADGQPILVNPLLREEQDLVSLLLSFGAKIDFAEDFINAKLIGHRYELIGRARIFNLKKKYIDLNFEGFYLEFTVGIIARTLARFMQGEVGSLYAAYVTVLSKILRVFKTATDIIPYQYMTNGPEIYDKKIRQALSQDLVLVPVSYEGHAITLIKYGNLLAKCDRGVKKIVDTVIIYQVGNPNAFTPDFLKEVMFNAKTDAFINEDIKKILNLKPLTTLPARYQLSGNCSWANVEAAVPAMMFLLMFRGNLESRGEIATLKKSIMNYYDTWVAWDKDRLLKEHIQSFQAVNREKRVAKASILAAILFQRCSTLHPKELERAKKILAVLSLPEYRFILKTYVKVYYTKIAGKMGEDFMQLLKACGIDLKAITARE